MKNTFQRLTFLFFLSFIFGTTFLCIKDILIIKKLQNTIDILTDSLGKVNFERFYLNQLISLNSCNTILSENLYAYELADEERQNPICLKTIVTSGKNKIIVRYTHIGCNACTDSTFNLIRRNKRLLDKFEVIVLVDFTDFQTYLKWRKLSEMTEKVLWLKKGELPFQIEKENASYIFTVDHSGIASSLFIPKKMFPKYLKNYLNGLGE